MLFRFVLSVSFCFTFRFEVLRPHPWRLGGVSVLVEALLLSPGFRPPREALLWSSGFRLPREAGAASMMSRSPANCYSGFRPPSEAGAADVAALASEVLLGFFSPKRSWGEKNPSNT